MRFIRECIIICTSIVVLGIGGETLNERLENKGDEIIEEIRGSAENIVCIIDLLSGAHKEIELYKDTNDGEKQKYLDIFFLVDKTGNRLAEIMVNRSEKKIVIKKIHGACKIVLYDPNTREKELLYKELILNDWKIYEIDNKIF